MSLRSRRDIAVCQMMLGLVLLPATGTAAAQEGERVVLELLPEAAPPEPGHPLIVSFVGRDYEEPISLEQEDEDERNPSALFLVEVIRVNRTGSVDDVAELWSPDERAELRSRVGGEAFERNQAMYRQIRVSLLIAEILYGPYEVLVVRHSGPMLGEFVHVYPTIRTDAGLFLTNRLKDDPQFSFLHSIYRWRFERERESRGETTPAGLE